MSERGYQRRRRRLIETMRDRGIDDLEVLRAFDRVPRHRFVPEAVLHRAYEDSALPIGFGQTISQPSIQALYLQTVGIGAGDRVLEVGTGSGFQTALLAHLADHVYSVERVRDLSARARRILDSLRVSNVALLVGDGTIGWSKYAPYDAILVTAGAPAVPDALLDQLAPDGCMLIPVGDHDQQRLLRIRRSDRGFVEDEVTECLFVPLVGRFGWTS